MELGRHLKELFGQRLATALCLALAVAAALTAAYEVSLMPPGLQTRSPEIAAATTEMLVDGPVSTVLDLRQGPADIEGMTNRAVLIGNVMVSEPVLAYIGRRAGIPRHMIRSRAPLTPDFPRPVTSFRDSPAAKDLLASPRQYRINIQTNPAVPVIKIYTQAPTVTAASMLANASVDGLRDYLAALARARATPPRNQVTLTQLGRARGQVINSGARTQLAVLAFLVVFGLSAATAIFLGRVGRGWSLAPQP